MQPKDRCRRPSSSYPRTSRSDFVFFFQAEDGIRDADVTGVQTCALPICCEAHLLADELMGMETYRRLMQCPEAETLAAFGEDRLPLDSALPVAQHAHRCPPCRADVESVRRMVRR